MWKRVDDLSLSERHAKVSLTAVGVWTYVLGHTDSHGRFHADSRVIKAKCMTFREDIRLVEIDAAITELSSVGLIHLYDVDGKRYFVLHRCGKYNPPGALRYNAPVFPEPPRSLCECLVEARRESGAKAPLVPSPSSSSSSSPEGEVQEGGPGPPLNRSTPGGMLAAVWKKHNPGAPINERQAADDFTFWLARGVEFKRAEVAVYDPAKCKGMMPKDIMRQLVPQSTSDPQAEAIRILNARKGPGIAR